MTALFLLLSCTPEPSVTPEAAPAAKAEHSGHWKRLDNLNFGHAGMVLAAHGDQVLIFGGFSPTAERLDLSAGKVLAIESAPFALQHASAVSLEQGVLIQGGSLPDGTLSERGLLWTPAGFQEVPGLKEPRSQASALGLNGGALICGGLGSAGPLSSCEVSTPASSQAAPSLPEARSGAHLVELGGAALLVGGQGEDAEEIWILQDEKWRVWAELDAPRWEHAVLVDGEQIYVLGGRDAQGALSSVEICSPKGCEAGPTLNEARAGLSAGWVGGGEMASEPGGARRIVVFGGLDVPDSPDALSSRTVELLSPGAGAWELAERSGQARRGALTFAPGDGTLVVVGGDNRGKLTTAVSRYSPLAKPPRVQEEPPEELDETQAPTSGEGTPPGPELPSAP